MKTALLDKISSVTRNAQLKREVRIGSEIPCEEGVVIAARVLTGGQGFRLCGRSLHVVPFAVAKRGVRERGSATCCDKSTCEWDDLSRESFTDRVQIADEWHAARSVLRS